MTSRLIDREAASRWWERNLPGCSASSVEEVRARLADRWVRIHHLPLSKRCPSTRHELQLAMGRHLTVLQRLFQPASELWIGSCTYPQEPVPTWRPESAERWFETTNADGLAIVVWLQTLASDAAEVADVIHQVIFDRASRVSIFAADRRSVYHPYDGGGDIVAETSEHADALRSEFDDWLSKRPDGL